jgi:hypothetical protein
MSGRWEDKMYRIQAHIERKQKTREDSCANCAKTHEDFVRSSKQLKQAEKLARACLSYRLPAHSSISGDYYIYTYDESIIGYPTVAILLRYCKNHRKLSANHQKEVYDQVEELLRRFDMRSIREDEYTSLLNNTHALSPLLSVKNKSSPKKTMPYRFLDCLLK